MDMFRRNNKVPSLSEKFCVEAAAVRSVEHKKTVFFKHLASALKICDWVWHVFKNIPHCDHIEQWTIYINIGHRAMNDIEAFFLSEHACIAGNFYASFLPAETFCNTHKKTCSGSDIQKKSAMRHIPADFTKVILKDLAHRLLVLIII